MNLSGLTDNEIWTSFKEGDNKALSFIYAENSIKLYRYGLKITPNIFLVEDSIHDLFSELIKNRKKLKSVDNIQFYLFKSFRRKLIRKLQQEKCFKQEDLLNSANFNIVWSAEQNIIVEEVTRQKSELLLKALIKLTPRQKEAIYLRFTKEMDYKEVAKVMEISVKACRNLVFKAIKSLKRAICQNGKNPLV